MTIRLLLKHLKADLRLCAGKHFWTPDEATALAFGRDPDRIDRDYLESFVFTYDSDSDFVFIVQFQKFYEAIAEAKRIGTLPRLIRPALFVEWAMKNSVDLHPEPIRFKREAEAPSSAARVEIQKHTDRLAQAQREVFRLNMLLAGLGTESDFDSSAYNNSTGGKYGGIATGGQTRRAPQTARSEDAFYDRAHDLAFGS